VGLDIGYWLLAVSGAGRAFVTGQGRTGARASARAGFGEVLVDLDREEGIRVPTAGVQPRGQVPPRLLGVSGLEQEADLEEPIGA
jgi:hypothetical protein